MAGLIGTGRQIDNPNMPDAHPARRRFPEPEKLCYLGEMSPIRPEIRYLAPNGITQVAGLGLGDPDIVPLWFGESDVTTLPE